MYLSRGLYVFPNKNTIRRFMYDGDEATELPEITFEQQLIDFLEIDLTPFNRLLDKLKAYTKENTTPDELLSVCRAVGYTAEIFCQEEPVYSFLLCTKLYVDSYDISSYEEIFEYKDHAVEMLRDMVHTQNIFFTITDAYCRFEGTHEEKTIKAFLGRETIFKCQFEQVIAHTDVGTEMFQMTRPKLPYSRGYRFDNLPAYIWYVFLNAMEFDTSFSQCDYCGHFFKPKTKKKTRYCDRVRADDGRTCKQIGPQQIYISECMLIAIPLFTLTTVFYDKVVLPYLSKYFEYIEGAYNIKLYLLIFAIYIFSTIFVLLIMILRFLRKTINEARRES